MNKSIHLTLSLLCYFASWPYNILVSQFLTCSSFHIPASNGFFIIFCLHPVQPVSLSFCLQVCILFSHPFLTSRYHLPVPSCHGNVAFQSQQWLHGAKTKTPFLVLLDFLVALGCPILHWSTSSLGHPYHTPSGLLSAISTFSPFPIHYPWLRSSMLEESLTSSLHSLWSARILTSYPLLQSVCLLYIFMWICQK